MVETTTTSDLLIQVTITHAPKMDLPYNVTVVSKESHRSEAVLTVSNAKAYAGVHVRDIIQKVLDLAEVIEPTPGHQ